MAWKNLVFFFVSFFAFAAGRKRGVGCDAKGKTGIHMIGA